MNQKTVKTAGQVSVIVLIIALMLMSPPLRLGLFILAALCAAVCAVFAVGKWRIAGIVLVLAALALAVAEYPAATSDMQDYRQRAKPKAAPTSLIPNQSAPLSFGTEKNSILSV